MAIPKLIHGSGRPLIYRVDFDGSIVDDHFPDIGPIRVDRKQIQVEGLIGRRKPLNMMGKDAISSKEVLQKIHARGGIIIGDTCRHHESKDAAAAWCLANDIPVDYWNENYPQLITEFGDCRKIYGDVCIDDRNLGSWNWWDVDADVEARTVWVEA